MDMWLRIKWFLVKLLSDFTKWCYKISNFSTNVVNAIENYFGDMNFLATFIQE
jgi:hypothetical protein